VNIVNGIFTIFNGFLVVVVGIIFCCTIIGLLWGPAVVMFGSGMIVKGFAQIGIGTYNAVKSRDR
tara:strand:- start:1067 stop:1261 length:195 start_codon:yes stop_codon:yes gene_type:complete